MSSPGNNPRVPKDVLRFTMRHGPGVHLLPGDSSLVMSHLTRVRTLIHLHPSPLKIPEEALIFGIGVVLFDVVLVRTYLELPACNDTALYYLMVQAQGKQDQLSTSIVRQLSHEEQALAACEGAHDTSDPRIDSTLGPHPKFLQYTADQPTFDSTIMRIVRSDGSAHVWPAPRDAGLTGGEPVSSDLPKPPLKPKPKPRPRKRPAEVYIQLIDNEHHSHNIIVLGPRQRCSSDSGVGSGIALTTKYEDQNSAHTRGGSTGAGRDPGPGKPCSEEAEDLAFNYVFQ